MINSHILEKDIILVFNEKDENTLFNIVKASVTWHQLKKMIEQKLLDSCWI